MRDIAVRLAPAQAEKEGDYSAECRLFAGKTGKVVRIPGVI